MKLFVVMTPSGIVTEKGETLFFDDKMNAKLIRDCHVGAWVSKGPDHWRHK